MGMDRKYGRVTTERGDIGPDEPVVVFRAQDALLPLVLASYRDMCMDAGSPQNHLDLIGGTIKAVNEWQRENYTKTPESRGWQSENVSP